MGNPCVSAQISHFLLLLVNSKSKANKFYSFSSIPPRLRLPPLAGRPSDTHH